MKFLESCVSNFIYQGQTLAKMDVISHFCKMILANLDCCNCPNASAYLERM